MVRVITGVCLARTVLCAYVLFVTWATPSRACLRLTVELEVVTTDTYIPIVLAGMHKWYGHHTILPSHHRLRLSFYKRNLSTLYWYDRCTFGLDPSANVLCYFVGSLPCDQYPVRGA